MLNSNVFFVILSCILITYIGQGRVYTNGFSISIFRREDCWIFIDRIHLDPGYMTVNSQIKLVLKNAKDGQAYNLQLVAIPQSIWHQSLTTKCNQTTLNNAQPQLNQKKEVVFQFGLNANNKYSAEVESKIQVPTQQSYHFVLRDCSNTLINDGYGRQSKISVLLDVRNNESHISASEDHYAWLLPLLILSGSAMLWLLHKDEQQQGDNWIKLAVKASLWMGVASILFKYIGYVMYAYRSGVEHGVFDVFYLLLHAVSDSLLIILIMLLSFGWTVTFKHARNFDIYFNSACLVGLANIIITMLNKISDGEPEKYHMYDSIPAYIMMGFRLTGLSVFLVGIGKSWANLHRNPNQQKIKIYLYHLTTIGFIYMLFVPVGFLAIGFVSNRYKKETMFFGMELTRFALNVWLGLLGCRKQSAYRAIIDESFMEKSDKHY